MDTVTVYGYQSVSVWIKGELVLFVASHLPVNGHELVPRLDFRSLCVREERYEECMRVVYERV
jgi:hypothetical protein